MISISVEKSARFQNLLNTSSTLTCIEDLHRWDTNVPLLNVLEICGSSVKGSGVSSGALVLNSRDLGITWDSNQRYIVHTTEGNFRLNNICDVFYDSDSCVKAIHDITVNKEGATQWRFDEDTDWINFKHFMFHGVDYIFLQHSASTEANDYFRVIYTMLMVFTVIIVTCVLLIKGI